MLQNHHYHVALNLFLCVIITFSDSLPFISLLNFEKISFGISNVQFRFGHISILQYSSAILPNLLLSKDFLILPNLIIPVTFLIWIFNKFILSKKTNSLIANNFLFFVGIFVLTKFTRFAEYGNDVAAHTLVFIILYNFLKIYTNDLVSIEKSKIIFSNGNNFIFNWFIMRII